MELIFEVRDADEGGYCARALGHAIFTEADTWDELRANVLEVTSLRFEDEASELRLVQLHLCEGRTDPGRSGVKLPRDVSADRLTRALASLGYVVVRPYMGNTEGRLKAGTEPRL
jgi:hypothetical protein